MLKIEGAASIEGGRDALGASEKDVELEDDAYLALHFEGSGHEEHRWLFQSHRDRQKFVWCLLQLSALATQSLPLAHGWPQRPSTVSGAQCENLAFAS